MNRSGPPAWAVWLLRRFCHADHLDEIQGDLEEAWHDRLQYMSAGRANWLFIREVITSARPEVISGERNSYPSSNQTIMIRNYLTIAYRNLKKKKLYSAINLLGLSVGMTCSLLILLFVLNEFSFDTFHQDADRIFRVTEAVKDKEGNLVENSAAVSWSVGPTLAGDFPDATVTRMYQAWQKDPLVVHRESEKSFYEEQLFFVDTTFFDMFSFPLVAGNPETAIKEPQSVVLSHSAARKFFGSEDPVGQTLWLENSLPLTVTGVAKDAPANSHFHFDFLIPLLNIQDIFDATGNNWQFQGWYWNPVHTYIKLPERYSEEQFRGTLPEFKEKHMPEHLQPMIDFDIQPLSDIHFTTNLYQELEPHRSRSSVYIAACIAVFILLIAGINFINLSTSMAVQRSREVALRKVLGSSRKSLILQFFGESVLLSVMSLVIAAGLAALTLGWFESVIGSSLNIGALITFEFILLVAGMSVLFGIFAGFYPAILLSGFQPASVLKSGKASAVSGGSWFRKALVVFQFSISIILLISAFVVFHQHEFLSSRSLGMKTEEIVMIPIRGTTIKDDPEAFKEQIKQVPGVISASAVSDIVGEDVPVRPFGLEGYDEMQNLPGLFTDHDFVETFGVELKEGRDFDVSNAADSTSFLVNEKMLEVLRDNEWEGRNVGWSRRANPIIGMVEDFNFMSLRTEVRPLLIGFADGFLAYMAVRVKGNNVYGSITDMENTWQQFEPEKPFMPFFLDERLDQLYQSEQKAGTMIGYFSGLAIFIAFLGLVGLVTYTTNTRVKEIGIRKVLGATAPNIVALLSRNFLLLVLIANAIAWPVAYELMSGWLEDFTYRIDMPWWLFALAGVISLTIALLTTGIQSYLAAQTNPTDTIREN